MHECQVWLGHNRWIKLPSSTSWWSSCARNDYWGSLWWHFNEDWKTKSFNNSMPYWLGWNWVNIKAKFHISYVWKMYLRVFCRSFFSNLSSIYRGGSAPTPIWLNSSNLLFFTNVGNFDSILFRINFAKRWRYLRPLGNKQMVNHICLLPFFLVHDHSPQFVFYCQIWACEISSSAKELTSSNACDWITLQICQHSSTIDDVFI